MLTTLLIMKLLISFVRDFPPPFIFSVLFGTSIFLPEYVFSSIDHIPRLVGLNRLQ